MLPWESSTAPGSNTFTPRMDQESARQAYTFCLLDRLQDALSRREVFVPASSRYGDPRVGLLSDEDWNTNRLQVCRVICHSPSAEKEIEALSTQLDAAYRRVAANLPEQCRRAHQKVDGKDRLVISPLDSLEESPSCAALRKTIASMLPRVDLPELLLEIHRLTGFADEFTHINESESRARGHPYRHLRRSVGRSVQHRLGASCSSRCSCPCHQGQT